MHPGAAESSREPGFQGMTGFTRRTLLSKAAAIAAAATAGCGGGSSTGVGDLGSAPSGSSPEPAVPPPSWAGSLRSGAWSEVPVRATLASIDPAKNPSLNPRFPDTPEWSENLLRQAMIVDAWCGAAYDERTDTMWLGLGGGHRDYAGNEIYRCHFHSEAPAWEMVRPPSGSSLNPIHTDDGLEATGLYEDGRPRACHSYNNWVYVPGAGPVLVAQPAVSWGASAGKRWSVWIREADGEHDLGADMPLFSLSDILAAGACYDSTRKAIWYKQKNLNKMFRYSLPAEGRAHLGTWSPLGADFQTAVAVSCCYVEGRDCILVGSGGNYSPGYEGWAVFDCAKLTWHRPPFEGSLPEGFRPGECQPRWVPTLGAACAWDNAGNTTQIVRLAPGKDPLVDPWRISALPVAQENALVPPRKTANGTFGRFAYSPRMGGFLVFSSTAGPTCFYKL